MRPAGRQLDTLGLSIKCNKAELPKCHKILMFTLTQVIFTLSANERETLWNCTRMVLLLPVMAIAFTFESLIFETLSQTVLVTCQWQFYWRWTHSMGCISNIACSRLTKQSLLWRQTQFVMKSVTRQLVSQISRTVTTTAGLLHRHLYKRNLDQCDFSLYWPSTGVFLVSWHLLSVLVDGVLWPYFFMNLRMLAYQNKTKSSAIAEIACGADVGAHSLNL